MNIEDELRKSLEGVERDLLNSPLKPTHVKAILRDIIAAVLAVVT